MVLILFLLFAEQFQQREDYDLIFYTCLDALIEFCQGPCIENQNCIINHESNIFPTIFSLLTQHKWDAVLFERILKFLFALKESRRSFDFLMESVTNEIYQKLVLSVYHGYFIEEADLAHNFYILCSELAKQNKSFEDIMKNTQHLDGNYQDVFKHLESITARIEIVKSDRTLEEVIFQIPKICQDLGKDVKLKIFHSCEPDEQGSKVYS